MERLEYTVNTIGTNTLLGMLCRKQNGTWLVDNVFGKEIRVNYTYCYMSHGDLMENVHKLYEAGAKKVILIEWEPEREFHFGDKVVIRPAQPKDPKWRV